MKLTSLCIFLFIITPNVRSSAVIEPAQTDIVAALPSSQQRAETLWQSYPIDKKLCTAIRYNRIDRVKHVVEKERANVNANTVNCRFPLAIAAQRNLIDIADYLVSHGAKIEIDAAFGMKISALEIAAKSRKNRAKMIELLIDQGTATSDSDNNQGAIGSKLERKKWVNGGILNRVIAKGHLSNIEVLLKNGADPNGFFKASSVLMDAANQLSIERVKLLIDYGADVNLKIPGNQTVLKRLKQKKTGKKQQQKKQALIDYLVSVGAK